MNKTIEKFCKENGLYLFEKRYKGISRKGYGIATDEDGVIANFRPWNDRSNYKWAVTFWGDIYPPRINKLRTFFTERITKDTLAELKARLDLRGHYVEKRREVKVTFEDGDSLTTSINGSIPQIRAYYRVGKMFNLGEGEKDRVVTVKEVKFL